MSSPSPVVLVTGSSRGLGRGVAEILAEAGFSVEEIRPVSELLDEPFDDVYYQHLLILSKI